MNSVLHLFGFETLFGICSRHKENTDAAARLGDYAAMKGI